MFKKVLSMFMSMVMMVSMLGIAGNVYASPTKLGAPTVSLGDTFAVEYDSTKTQKKDYCACFTPDKTAYYEFVFDTNLAGKSSKAELSAELELKNGDWVNEEYMDNTDDAIIIAEKMYAGTAYYLSIQGENCGVYKSNVTLRKHKHALESNTMPAIYVKFDKDEFELDEDIIIKEDGKVYDMCEYCDYTKKLSTIYAPSKIELSRTSYVYDGNAKKPSVTVKDRKGNKIPSSNYKVKYSKNKNVGTATVRVEFNDEEYAGSMEKTFTIKPKATSISKLTPASKGFTAKWSKRTAQTSGYQLQLATNSAFSKGKKTYTIAGTATTSKKVTGLKGKKKYYVRIRTYKTVNGKKYYSAWSKTKTVTTKK